MALNPYLSEFVFKVCAAAIQRDGDDAAKLTATAENVVLFREQGAITDAQVAALSEMVGVEVDVPDAPDTWEDNVAAIGELVTEHDDAIAELGEVVSEIIGGE